MNKMTKGAIATTVGVLLLVGGGGTLATWNDSEGTDAGIVTAGNLDLTAGAGVWKVESVVDGLTTQTVINNIGLYRIVPGDKLTYTQSNIDVTLDGNNISADLTVNTAGVAETFDETTYNVSEVVLRNSNGIVVPTTLTDDVHDITATVTFDFLETTSGQLSTNATYNFTSVAFELTQNAPAPADEA